MREFCDAVPNVGHFLMNQKTDGAHTLTSRATSPLGPDRNGVGEAKEPALPRVFITNLLTILGLGVLVSIWILHYTQWFPAIGGILALGGLVSWLAFVSRILREERLEALQAWADKAVFCSRATLAVVGTLAICLIVAANFLGGIQVEGARGSSDRFVRLSHLGTNGADDLRLRPGEVVRRPLVTRWWRPRAWRVKVSGYPDEVVTVRPWPRVNLTVPSSFVRPVVLVRPTVDMFDVVHHMPRTLAVRVGSQEYKTPFNGYAVWIGCDEDVAVPLQMELAWSAEVGERRSAVNYWLHPKALTNERFELPAGTELTVRVFDQEQTLAERTVAVRPATTFFPQEVVLDVQH